MIAMFVSANQFSIEEDHTEEFKTGRRIKANCGVDGYKYSTILSSTYSSPHTVITIVENILTSNLEDVLYGIVNIGETGSFPDHLHDGTEGQGGILPYITADTFSTSSGILQTQINNKPDTFLELDDTPSTYDSGKYAISTSSGIVWGDIEASNAQTFLDLTDTPSSYSGHIDELLKVTISGIDFIQLPPYNMFTATSGIPSEGSPLDYHLNLNNGDLYEKVQGASFYDDIKFNIPSMTHAASNTLNGNPEDLSDGNAGTYWQDDIYTNQWVSIDLGISKNIYKVLLQGMISERFTKNFRIEGSINNVDWDVVYTGVTIQDNDAQEFTFPTISVSYRYWRLYMIDTWETSLLLMTRFELFVGYTSDNYSWQVQGNVRGSTASYSFIDLIDTPHTYSETEGKFAQSTGSGVVWTTISGTPVTETWYVGETTPSGICNVGDFYIDSHANKIYENNSPATFTAKSIIIDITDGWGDGNYVGFRSVGLKLSSTKVSTPLSTLTGYGTSSSFDPVYAFMDEVLKTGGSLTNNGWTSDPGYITNQRIVCVFASPIVFDSMVINNYHHYGYAATRGMKNINIYFSSDIIISTTYGETIPNSSLAFTGQIRQHTDLDEADDIIMALIPPITWDVVLNTISSFYDLSDTPSSYFGTEGKFAQSTGSGIVWTTVSGGFSNVQTFLDLTDTPDLYSDGLFAQSTGSGIVWTTISGNGTNGTNGTNGADGNVWLFGTSSPIIGIGNALDYYLNQTTFDVFRKDSATYGSNLITDISSCSASAGDAGNVIVNGQMWVIYDAPAGTWWKYDFGVGNEKAFSKVVIKQGWGGYTFCNYEIQGSNNNIDWITLEDVSVACTGGTTNTIELYNDISYRYLILNHGATNLGLETLNVYAVNAYDWRNIGNIKGPDGTTISGVASNFINLLDVPPTYSGTEGKFAQSTGSGIVWTTVSSGVQSFIDLTDAPTSYAGHEGEFLKVVGNTLEFANVSGTTAIITDGFFELDEYGGLMPTTSSGFEIILISPNNSRWKLIVDDSGNLSTGTI